jgi:hypothetical protein
VGFPAGVLSRETGGAVAHFVGVFALDVGSHGLDQALHAQVLEAVGT